MPVKLESRAGGSCPKFFRAACREGRNKQDGFEDVGRELARNLQSLAPEDLAQDAWLERVGRLSALLDVCDDQRALAWFDRELPRCMALVPRSRREEFLCGVIRFALEEEIDITYS